ncbi:MAG: MBL fold metallo-hydrolase [Candidatus Bathyarchaeota archaeon]
MQIVFIGSGGPVITLERSCSSILVDEDILMDCGSGSLKNLKIMEADLKKIRRILISHFHADHISDLVPLLWAMQMEGYNKSLEICGLEGIEDLTKTLLDSMYFPKEITNLKLIFKSLSGTEEFDGISICRTVHNPPNIAYKIRREGKSVCYTGDTQFHDSIAHFASNCDLLIHEALFLDHQKELALLTNHSTASEAGKIAKMANVKKLALTHIFPLNKGNENELLRQAGKEFDGEIILAKDLLTLQI